jgi:hypothetical protein
MKTIEFKTVSPLFEMERDDIKPFTTRLYDEKDPRFKDAGFSPVGVIIKITNPVNGESFCRVVDRVEFLPVKPDWVNFYWITGVF